MSPCFHLFLALSLCACIKKIKIKGIIFVLTGDLSEKQKNTHLPFARNLAAAQR
jgi:hypothetical protein